MEHVHFQRTAFFFLFLFLSNGIKNFRFVVQKKSSLVHAIIGLSSIEDGKDTMERRGRRQRRLRPRKQR